MAIKKTGEISTQVDSGKVRLVNNKSVGFDVTLLNGTNLHVGPWVKGSEINVSDAVFRSLLPPYILRLAKKGEIQILSAGGE